MKVIIPTWGRPNSQPTYDLFEEAEMEPVLAVDNPEHAGGRRHVVIPHENIGEARQGILDMFPGKVFMIDDDIKFYTYNQELDKHVRVDYTCMYSLYVHVFENLEEYAHIGFPDRFMVHTRTRPYENNKRYLKAVGLNSELFPEPPPRYRLPVSEDIDFNLQLMTRGFPNLILTEWAVDDNAQYADGGCQRYRTQEMEKQCCLTMKNLWPEYCSYTVDKEGTHRMRVQWKKASRYTPRPPAPRLL